MKQSDASKSSSINLYCICGCERGVTGSTLSNALKELDSFRHDHSGKGHKIISREEWQEMKRDLTITSSYGDDK